MKSIRTTVWDGVGRATDGDGNSVKVSTFDCTYERLNRTLELCVNLGQLGLTVILLRVAWELLKLMTWTGTAQ